MEYAVDSIALEMTEDGNYSSVCNLIIPLDNLDNTFKLFSDTLCSEIYSNLSSDKLIYLFEQLISCSMSACIPESVYSMDITKDKCNGYIDDLSSCLDKYVDDLSFSNSFSKYIYSTILEIGVLTYEAIYEYVNNDTTVIVTELPFHHGLHEDKLLLAFNNVNINSNYGIECNSTLLLSMFKIRSPYEHKR